jgi:hypothetical protein
LTATRRRQPARRRPPASPPRFALPSPLVLLGAVIALAVAILGISAWSYFSDRDWATVARVGDQDINRAAVRDRTMVLQFVIDQQIAAIESLRSGGRIDASEAAAMVSRLEAASTDPRKVALASLVDGTLVHAQVATDGLGLATIDPADELRRARIEPTDRRLAWLRIAWQPGASTTGSTVIRPSDAAPDSASMLALGAELRTALATGSTRESLAAQYAGSGWVTTAQTEWLAVTQPPDDLEPELVAAARAAGVGPLQPIVGVGWVAVGDVVDVLERPQPGTSGKLLDDARLAGISDQAIRAWAVERGERRTVEASLMAQWRQASLDQVRAEEVVIGPADPEGAAGPWVQLAHLTIADLPAERIPAGAGTAAERLASQLRAIPPAERRAAFKSLVDAVRDPARSGELGFFVKEQLTPALGAAAFGDESASAVVGPIATSAGDELFLVETRYQGPLDDRSIGALIDLRSGGASGLSVARATAPAESARSLGGPWRAVAEVPPASPAARALIETPVGGLSDPFVLEHQLVVVRILERRNAPLNSDALARLAVGGFDAWLAGRHIASPVTFAPSETATPSSDPAASGLPTGLPQATPRGPVAPTIPASS